MSGEQTEGQVALGWLLSVAGDNETLVGEGGQWEEATEPNP